MSGNTIRHVTASNLFVGQDTSKGLALVLNSVDLPEFNEKTKDFQPGGSPMGVKLGMQKMEPPEVSFKLEGYNPEVLTEFMKPKRIWYTMRANIRDVAEQTDTALKILIEGRLTQVKRSEFGGDDSITSDYKLTDIFHYEETWGTEEKFYLNFLEGFAGFRVNGVQIFSDVARNLGL